MKNSSKEKEGRKSLQRTASLTEVKAPTGTADQQCYFSSSGSGIKINILKESDQDYPENRRGKDSFLPIREELQISIDF